VTKVFISYSRKDKAFAEKLNIALQEIGLGSWIDWIDIPPTADWWDQIEKGIESADAFLFLLSPESVVSEVCGREINHAVKNGKRLIPLIARDVNSQDVNAALRKLNWIYFREQDNFETSLRKLEAGIKTDLGWVESHRRLQVRAIEWEKRKDPSLLLRGKDLRDAEEQLANAGQKDPQPTDLQRQYVLESRRRESQTRNTVLTVGGIVLVILAFLSLFAFNQRNLANSNAITAVANQYIAQTAQVDAVHQKETAIANEQEAQRQSRIARADELAAIAINQLTIDQERSLLIALAANEYAHTLEANDALRRALQAFPVQSVVQQCPVDTFYEDPLLYLQYGYSDDATKLAIFCDLPPRRIRILDTSNGKVLLDIPLGDDIYFVYNFNFSADGSTFVYTARGQGGGSLAGVAVVWNITTGKQVFVSPEAGTRGELSREGSRLWFYSPDAYVNEVFGPFTFVYDLRNQQQVAQIPVSYQVSMGSRLGENQIALASEKLLAIYDLTDLTRKELRINNGEQLIELANTIVTPDGLVGIIKDSNLNIVNFSSGENEASIPIGDVMPASVLLSPNNSQIALVYDNRIELRNIQDPGSVLVLSGHESPIGAIQFSEDSKLLVSTGLDTTGRVWDTQTGKLRSTINKVVGAAFSPDNKYLIIQTTDANLLSWDVSNTGEVASINLGKPLNRAWFSDDDQTIHITTEDGEEITWNWLQPEQDYFFTSSETGNIANLQSTWEFLSPNEKYRVEIDSTNEMRVWNSETNELVFDTRVSSDRINSVQFSPDSMKLIIAFGSPFVSRAVGDIGWLPFRTPGELDHTAAIWDLQAKEKVAILRGFTDAVNSAVFSHNSKYIVAASSDGYARVYLTATKDLEILAKQRIVRSPPELTCEERGVFLREKLICSVATAEK
jgi:WD40 repeat protein